MGDHVFRERVGRLDALDRDEIERFAAFVIGDPSSRSGRETRYGSKGARKVSWSGGKPFLYWNHEVEDGGPGAAIQLARVELRLSFGEAVERVERFFGLHGAAPEPISAGETARRERAAEKSRRKREKEDANAIAFAQRFAAESLSVQPGSLAWHYLTETRRIAPPASGWPEAVRFHPMRNAMVMLSTTPAGEVRACQVVRLTQEAKKRDTFKRTHGRKAGAAARLLGGNPAAKFVLLAEGPETVLAVFSAMCNDIREARSALGPIAGCSIADVPADSIIGVCRDDDAPGCPADVALARQIEAWRADGWDVRAISPSGGTRADKFDFADLFAEGGPEAVRACILAALNPPDPSEKLVPEAVKGEAPEFCTDYVGRERVAAQIAAFERDALAYDMRGNDEAEPPVTMQRATVGTGKSHAIRASTALRLVAMRRSGDRRNRALLVPAHRLGREQAAAFLDLPEVKVAGLKIAIRRGRDAEDPNRPGEKMCRKREEVEAARKLHLDVPKSVCAFCPFGPSGDGTCAYLAQEAECSEADLILGAHQLACEDVPKSMGEFAAVVFDERPLASFISTSSTISIADWRRPHTVNGFADEGGTDRLDYLHRLLADIFERNGKGPLRLDLLRECGLTADAADVAYRMEWATKVEPNFEEAMSEVDRAEAMRRAEVNANLSARAGVWRAVAAALRGDRIATGWLRVDGDLIRLRWRRKVGKGWNVPTLILDATARPVAYGAVWPNLTVLDPVNVAAPYQRVTQMLDGAYALRSLDVAGAIRLMREAEKLGDEEVAARRQQEAKRRERNVVKLHALLCREVRRYAPGKVLVVVQKAVEDKLRDLGKLPANMDLAHHNSLAGRDEWGPGPGRDGVRALIVVGRTLPPDDVVVAQAEALTGDAIAEADKRYERAPAMRTMADGRRFKAEAWRHRHPVAEDLRWMSCEGEIIQIIGRARGVNRTAANPVDILILTDVPLDLPLHSTIRRDDVKEGPLDRMLAAEGVALLKPADMARAFDKWWRTTNAAKCAMRYWVRRVADQMGSNPYYESNNRGLTPSASGGLRRVTFHLAGERISISEAYFDPGRVPDIETWLTDHLGELAGPPLIDDVATLATAEELPVAGSNAPAAALEPVEVPKEAEIIPIAAQSPAAEPEQAPATRSSRLFLFFPPMHGTVPERQEAPGRLPENAVALAERRARADEPMLAVAQAPASA